MRLLATLLVLSTAAPAQAMPPCPVRMAARILASPYVRSNWSLSFLNGLCAPGPAERELRREIRWPAAATERIAERLRGELGVDSRAAVYAQCEAESPELVLLLDFRRGERSVAYAGFTYRRDAIGRLQGELLNFYKDPRENDVRFAGATLAAVDALVNAPLGLRELRVHADTIGRYVWAMNGFRFRNAIWYRDVDGDVMVLQEMARRNFRRFLRRHELRVTDLVLRTDGELRPIRSFAELTTPGDYARLEHAAGRAVRIRPYVSNDAEERPIFGDPAELPVGRAFLLGPRLPQPGDRAVIHTSQRSPRSAYSMPDYRGVRPVVTE